MITKEDRICYIILIGLGLISYVITFAIGKDFILAQTKFVTDAVLVDVKVTEDKRLKSKKDRENDPHNQYQTYYEYDLTKEMRICFLTTSQSRLRRASSPNIGEPRDRKIISERYFISSIVNVTINMMNLRKRRSLSK